MKGLEVLPVELENVQEVYRIVLTVFHKRALQEVLLQKLVTIKITTVMALQMKVSHNPVIPGLQAQEELANASQELKLALLVLGELVPTRLFRLQKVVMAKITIATVQ